MIIQITIKMENIQKKGIRNEVSKKVDETEVVTTINQSAEQITLTGNRLVVQANNFKLDAEGNLICTNAKVTGEINSVSGTIGGWIIDNNGINNGNLFMPYNIN